MGRDRSMDKIKHGHVDAFICRCMVENFLALGVISMRLVIVFEESLHNASSIMRAHVPACTANDRYTILQLEGSMLLYIDDVAEKTELMTAI